jgi:heme-degrading monooxygenase HmoA
MYAVVVTFHGTTQGVKEEAERRFRDQVLPAAQALPGFKGAYTLLHRAHAKLLRVTLWETEEAATAAARALERARREDAAAIGSSVPRPELYEVIAQG